MPDSDLSYELARWYASPTGQELRQRIIAAMPEVLATIPGTDHAQITVGDWPSLYKEALDLNYQSFFSEHDVTGVEANSLDSLLLIHALDVSKDPHRILHIADKLVAKSGHLIIVGFNPVSFWGVLRLFMVWSHRSPWRSGFYSLWRLRDWLRVLNYEVRLQTSLVQLPPLPSARWYSGFRWLDSILHWLMPNWGAINIIVAKRPLFPMSGIKKRWREEGIRPTVIPEATTRTLREKSKS